MSPAVISITIVAYFIILFTISYIAGRKADNEGFFVGNRKSAWYIVAFAMIGSTISGVTFVSVPGMVQTSSFSYLQMVLRFIVGQITNALFTFLGLCLLIKRQDKETSHTTHTTKQEIK